MNYRILFKFLGIFLAATGATMVPCWMWAIYFGEWRVLLDFIGSTVVSFLMGLVLFLAGRKADNRFYQREALGLVALGWIVAPVVGALPFWWTGVLGPVDAYFESVSGYTTTGASVFTAEIFESCPKSLMFWRSFTHWLGGIGIILLFIAVLPYLGAGGKQMLRSEQSSIDPQALRPRVRDTALSLLKVYLSLTVLQTLALMVAGMSFFDALCHAFGALATGGYSTRPASVADYHSPLIEFVLIVCMISGATDFALYAAAIKGRWQDFRRDSQWHVYLGILAVATLLVTMDLLGTGTAIDLPSKLDIHEERAYYQEQPLQALRHAAFAVVSIGTTTGFGTEDFDQWPYLSRTILVVLMIMGGCAGSTAGGLKILRVVILAKMLYWRLESTFRPKTVRAIRIRGDIIDHPAQMAVYGYFALYTTWFAFSLLVLSGIGLPFDSAFSAVAACLNGVGPGLELVGPAMNYAFLPAIGKLFLCLCMIMGRLELITVMVLAMPSFWRPR
ncbi:MAG: potassium transporter [Candidatus Hydrogenedentota bacterium]